MSTQESVGRSPSARDRVLRLRRTVRAYLRRISSWSARARPFWTFVGVIAATWWVIGWFADGASHLAVAGVSLEIAGIALVGAGINRAVAEHGGVSIAGRVQAWIADFPRARGPEQIGVPLTASFGILMGDEFTATVGPPHADSSIEQRLAQIEANLPRIEKQLNSVQKTVRDRFIRIEKQIKAEARSRDADYKELKGAVSKIAIGDWDWEIVGLAWVAIGLLLNSWAGLITATPT